MHGAGGLGPGVDEPHLFHVPPESPVPGRPQDRVRHGSRARAAAPAAAWRHKEEEDGAVRGRTFGAVVEGGGAAAAVTVASPVRRRAWPRRPWRRRLRTRDPSALCMTHGGSTTRIILVNRE
jgi:hypothetical protein